MKLRPSAFLIFAFYSFTILSNVLWRNIVSKTNYDSPKRKKKKEKLWFFKSEFEFPAKSATSSQLISSSFADETLAARFFNFCLLFSCNSIKCTLKKYMPCPFTGRKMFCAGPNFLCRTRKLLTFCASHKHFVPDKKMICIQ